jgi:Uma2 family endonuclease
MPVAAMTDEEFAALCTDRRDDFIEVTAGGEILITPPKYSSSGARSGEMGRQLQQWSEQQKSGITTGGRSSFALQNGARRSASAAWTREDRVAALDPATIERFWHLCPDFVIELRSHTDHLPILRAKMREWIKSGPQLAWLIDPERRAVEIYRPDREPETLEEPVSVSGEGPVEGFVLDLPPVWNPLAS